MVKIEAVLHPEEAELVWTMLNHAATQLTREPGSLTCDDSPPAHEPAPAQPAIRIEESQGALSAETREPPGLDMGSALPIAQLPAPMSDSAVPALELDSSRIAVATSDPASPSPVEHLTVPMSDDAMHAHERKPAGSAVSTPPAAGATCQEAHSAETRQLPADTMAPPSPFSHMAACRRRGAMPAPELPHSVVSMSPTAGTAMYEGTLSAETRELVLDCGVASTPLLVGTVISPVGDCVEATASHAPTELADETSLLWQLVDEADAHHNEATAADDRATAGTQAHQSVVLEAHDNVASMLHQRADATRRAFDRADALVAVAQGYLRGDRPNRSPIEITLTIPASSLRASDGDPVDVAAIGESFVSREAARRLSCDGGVVEIVEDEQGAPLSVGRKRRTISGPLKRALHQRDKTCMYPGCTNRLFLEGHHIKHWADGGETSVMNAILLCTRHHHHVHEYGYTIELGPDQRPQFRDPQGRLVVASPARPVTADLGWPHIRAANEPLAIDAETPACGWDGSTPDYGAIVGHLLAASGLPRPRHGSETGCSS